MESSNKERLTLQIDKNLNPFESYRAELTAEDIAEYFVPPHFLSRLTGTSPVMLIGGRGTGKTTLFKWLSYQNQNAINNNNMVNIGFFGVYWRIDTNYVTAFNGPEFDTRTWNKIFGHYLNVTFCLELCKVILDIKKHNILSVESEVCRKVSKQFYSEKIITNFEDLFEFLLDTQIEIEQYVNNFEFVKRPLLSIMEKPYEVFCTELSNDILFENKWFFFLIDEYETLSENQQMIINSFIKHSKKPYTFKVCMRSKGLKTKETLSISESLSSSADYQKLDLSDDFDKDNYTKFVIEICKKRLDKLPGFKEKGYADVSILLPGIKPTDEAKRIEKLSRKKELPYLKKFRKLLLQDSSLSQIERVNIEKRILEDHDPIIKRLFVSLLERDNDTKDLLKEYDLYFNSRPSKFTKNEEWIHNSKMGILFLLCYEYNMQKLYCGFNTFIQLSSGVIRDFLELISISFMYALQNDYSMDNPEPISLEVQNRAARYVAHKRLTEIDSIQPNGVLIKNFVLTLGKIYENFHKDSKQSEQEKNEFTTDVSELDKATEQILNTAVRWSVLYEVTSTKDKNEYDIKNFDYILNPIYSPYFQISYRKGRKITLDPQQLYSLMFDGKDGRRKVFNQIFKNKKAQSDLIAPLFPQIDLTEGR